MSIPHPILKRHDKRLCRDPQFENKKSVTSQYEFISVRKKGLLIT